LNFFLIEQLYQVPKTILQQKELVEGDQNLKIN